MKNLFLEIIGWLAVISTIIAYGLMSTKIIEPGMLYQIMNAAGATGIIAISLYKKVYQLVAFNIVWLMIALYAIFQLIKGGSL
jgi:hypothetical protein